MPKFFVENIGRFPISISGDTASHITNSLRMKPLDEIVLFDGRGYDYLCRIIKVGNPVVVELIEKRLNQSEPSVQIHLYQAMPKGSKFETIIQKSVELGVFSITPVLTSRCISRPDEKSFCKKLQRYQRISMEAAQQSGRGLIPQIKSMLSFEQAIEEMAQSSNKILFYECACDRLTDCLSEQTKEISIMIGSEGGFSPDEVLFAQSHHLQIASLGERILRCETAPLCALSILLYHTKNI